VRVISNKRLVDFARRRPGATAPLQCWRKLIESRSFATFAELKSVFGSVDRVGDFHVFDIAGNKYRLIAAIHFNRQFVYIRHVFTHAEYDRWTP
jgi:mRNA interferase HigB